MIQLHSWMLLICTGVGHGGKRMWKMSKRPWRQWIDTACPFWLNICHTWCCIAPLCEPLHALLLETCFQITDGKLHELWHSSTIQRDLKVLFARMSDWWTNSRSRLATAGFARPRYAYLLCGWGAHICEVSKLIMYLNYLDVKSITITEHRHVLPSTSMTSWGTSNTCPWWATWHPSTKYPALAMLFERLADSSPAWKHWLRSLFHHCVILFLRSLGLAWFSNTSLLDLVQYRYEPFKRFHGFQFLGLVLIKRVYSGFRSTRNLLLTVLTSWLIATQLGFRPGPGSMLQGPILGCSPNSGWCPRFSAGQCLPKSQQANIPKSQQKKHQQANQKAKRSQEFSNPKKKITGFFPVWVNSAPPMACGWREPHLRWGWRTTPGLYREDPRILLLIVAGHFCNNSYQIYSILQILHKFVFGVLNAKVLKTKKTLRGVRLVRRLFCRENATER